MTHPVRFVVLRVRVRVRKSMARAAALAVVSAGGCNKVSSFEFGPESRLSVGQAFLVHVEEKVLLSDIFLEELDDNTRKNWCLLIDFEMCKAGWNDAAAWKQRGKTIRAQQESISKRICEKI